MKINAIPKNDANSLNTDESTATRPKYKKENALAFVLISGAGGVCQPEAHSHYKETCWHTTISTLQNKHGIQFMRKLDPAPKYRKPFMRYWLADKKSVERAFNLLNDMRTKRNVKPLSRQWLDSSYGDK
jgi:hypothetical protein